MTPKRPAPISILVVDPHPIFRWGMRAALDADRLMRVVGEAGSGVDAIARAMALRPAVVVTELDLSDGTALPAIRVLEAVVPGVRVLAVAARTDPLSVLAALEAGADGIVTKRSDADEIVRAVLAVWAGERVLDRDAIVAFVGRVLDRRTLPSVPPSDRQRIVQARLTAGATSEEIAAALGPVFEQLEDKLGAIDGPAGAQPVETIL
jgi:DNA-binding NarL/FixJ family response regulator